ncbi:hypothetical protein SAMN05518865_108266 [Duganella sp. CF458]|uniref:hypothetical protein n=1 Tax=Duganella sp. CF458 TaxID=1884368 RepID=UPI0008DED955|nr:hypothetical protein [Duganella sp. CF458]SFG13475.1 hypothetical protein SAMN05518865_108266 [Duganella sp. CF458]
MVYSDSNGSQLWTTLSPDCMSSSQAAQINGQYSSVPAPALMGDKLYMVYTSNTSSQLYWTQSPDGVNWSGALPIQGQNTSIPALAALGETLCMVYSDASSSQLWSSTSPDGVNWSAAQQIQGETYHPRRRALLHEPQDRSRLKVRPVFSFKFLTMQLRAPLLTPSRSLKTQWPRQFAHRSGS